MSGNQATFDKVGGEFVAYYDTVRGHVREEVTRFNLEPYLTKEASALDVGGGDGRDAVWLARHGYQVTLIDPSEEMAVKAQQSVDDAGYKDKIEIIHGDPQKNGPDNQYDLVLSHGVLMYVEDPQAHLNLLRSKVKNDGTVSLLTKGKTGGMLRLMTRQQPERAHELNMSGKLVNNLGESVLAVDEVSIHQLLESSNLELIEWYGVRVVSDEDNRALPEVDQEELDKIITIESDLSRKTSTKGIGQMLHFICEPTGKGAS